MTIHYNNYHPYPKSSIISDLKYIDFNNVKKVILFVSFIDKGTYSSLISKLSCLFSNVITLIYCVNYAFQKEIEQEKNNLKKIEELHKKHISKDSYFNYFVKAEIIFIQKPIDITQLYLVNEMNEIYKIYIENRDNCINEKYINDHFIICEDKEKNNINQIIIFYTKINNINKILAKINNINKIVNNNGEKNDK